MFCDTGPLVALIDSRQPQHAAISSLFREAPRPLISTWACAVESMYLLRARGGWPFQRQCWKLIDTGVVRLHSHHPSEIPRIGVLMARYRNVPMDFADASLMTAAEILSDRQMISFDNDFRIYRFDDGGFFDVVP